MKRVRLGGLYQFKPTNLDLVCSSTSSLPHGTLQRVIQPPNTPANGTMGMCYTETLTGQFVGLVNIASLERL